MIKYQDRLDEPEIKKILQKPERKGALLLPVVIIAIVSFAVYFNALFNGFVYDDAFQVVNNRWIRDIKHIPEMFSGSAWSFSGRISNYYRPLMHLLYMTTYQLFGLQPWGFHLVNIIFHAGNAVLVFILAARLLGDSLSRPPHSKGGDKEGLKGDVSPPLPDSRSAHRVSPRIACHSLTSDDSRFLAFIAALLFATHPIHTEAVTWVAGITELSFTFFSLLAFYFYIRSKEGFAFVRSLLSAAFFALASLCKETALVLPVILLTYDFAFRKEKAGSRSLIRGYFPYIVVMAVYLFVRFRVLGGFAPGKGHDDFRGELSTYQNVINIFPLFILYLKKLFLPLDLKAWYVFHPIASLREGLVPFLGSIACAVVIFVAWRKDRMAFFGLILVVIPLLPVFYIPAIAVPFAERYLYLPSFGFVLLAALLIDKAFTKRRWMFPVMTFIFAMIIFYSLETVQRNTVWKDNYTFWTDTVRNSPDGLIPRYNLGVELLARGRTDDAIEQFRSALRLDPDFSPARNNLGSAYIRKGLMDEAIAELRTAVRIDPTYAEAHNNLGSAYGEKGFAGRAVDEFKIAVALKPDFADAYNNLGISYWKSGEFEKALLYFGQAVRLNPYNTSYRDNLYSVNEVKRFREGAMLKNEKH